MIKRVLFACTIAAVITLSACEPRSKVPQFNQDELHPGGSMTAKRLSDRTFVVAGETVSRKDELRFWTGFSLFRDPWVIAPSSTKDRDGLGPLFQTRSCISCHVGGARGPEFQQGVSRPAALVMKLGPTVDGASQRDPVYGGQIQPRAIKIAHKRLPQMVKGEANIRVDYTEVEGQYRDGTSYSLQKPDYDVVDLSYGELAKNIGISPRFAPVIYGTGLIDAIADSDLIALEDPSDKDNDGISPRYNRVVNVKTGLQEIGRFGLKASHPTLTQQVAAAFRHDIGVTNSFFPEETCTAAQTDCTIASSLGGHTDIEIPDKLLSLVRDFNYWLAVPPARNLEGEKEQTGRALFYQANCHACHTPSFKTSSSYPDDNLANQTIYPYSNFALHDMGEALADGVSEQGATGREWRTAPLWGLGMQIQYRKKTRFLHDGRARNLQEAILWHGGEAQQSKNAFIEMNKHDRDALITFLKAI